MEKQAWHYKVWKAWGKRVYNDTLGRDDFMDEGKIHHQDSFYNIQDDGITYEYQNMEVKDKFYFKMKKDNTNYIVPKRFKDDLPINPSAWIDFKLKEKDTKLWKFVTEADSMSIPAEECIGGGYMNFLNMWNPMEYEGGCERTWLFLKIIANTEGVKLGICGKTASGKNSNLVLMNYMRRGVADSVLTPSSAKFYYTIYHNQHINIDEVTSWSGVKVREIEEYVSKIADENPDLSKFTMDKASMMQSDLENKSVTFTFNPLSPRNKHTFDSRFKNADKILDRYALFLLDGRVTETELKTPNSRQVKQLLETNFGDMCKIASEEHFWRKHYHKYLHNWNYAYCPFTTTRHMNNMRPILEKLDVLSNSQEEFNDWMHWLKTKRDDYNHMVSTEPETILTKSVSVESNKLMGY